MSDIRDIAGEMQDHLWDFRPKVRVLGNSRYWVYIDAKSISTDVHPTLLFDMCLDFISQHIRKYNSEIDYITYILENFVIVKMSDDINMRTFQSKKLETITLSDCFFRDVEFVECDFDDVHFTNCAFHNRLRFTKCKYNDTIIDMIAEDGGVVLLDDDDSNLLVSGRTPVILGNTCIS